MENNFFCKNIFSAKFITVKFCAVLFLFSSCAVVEQTSRDNFPQEINIVKFYEPDVRVLLNFPQKLDTTKPTLLILYALPNGNSIEMTFGKILTPNDDWHFDIQHIAAQTRFIRKALKEKNIIVAYLEAEEKSWPRWRQKHSDSLQNIIRIVDQIRLETGNPTEVALTGHSGGGSFITGFINAYEHIPAYIFRIAYLDANYSYDDSLHHGRKIIEWLKKDTAHTLSVIAYDDREITYNGKKVVSPTGGTFRATDRMIQRFKREEKLSFHQDSTIQYYAALNNQAQFIIHTNPDTLILHTVLVEKNGFIHALLVNTPYENIEYTFFGTRAYSQYIQKEIPWQKLP
ncbi:MAG: hypothetical protein H3C35_05825 [Bacteroidetes bacterium]|nr:hypothetical protein [Bacteroidota bacterium]